MALIRVLHVSDLHARPEVRRDLDIVVEAFLARVQVIVESHEGAIDCVAFTGDVAHSGKPHQYDCAREAFFDPLMSTLSLSKSELLLVPGNHDVDRDSLDTTLEDRLVRTLDCREAVNRLQDDDEDRGRALARLRAYRAFVHDYCGLPEDQCDPCFSMTQRVNVKGFRLGFACLNSAWRCSSDRDAGKLLIGERQIDSAVSALADTDFRLALAHHPLRWLADFDQRDSQQRLVAAFDVVLSGHIHDPGPIVIEGAQGRCLLAQAGALFDGRSFNGFSVLELDTESLHGRVRMWRYYDDRRVFDRDLLVAEDGLFDFSLAPTSPTREEVSTIVKAPSDSPLITMAAVPETQARRERVIDTLLCVNGRAGGPWALGVALGLMDHGPSVADDGTLALAAMSALAAKSERLRSVWETLLAIGLRLTETEEPTGLVCSDLLVQLEEVEEVFRENDPLTLLMELDSVVFGIVNPERPDPNALAGVDRLLADGEPEQALLTLAESPGEDPRVRARLAEANAALRNHAKVISILGQVEPDSLSRSELEHLVWALFEEGEFEKAPALLTLHTDKYSDGPARLYRLGLVTKHPPARREKREL